MAVAGVTKLVTLSEDVSGTPGRSQGASSFGIGLQPNLLGYSSPIRQEPDDQRRSVEKGRELGPRHSRWNGYGPKPAHVGSTGAP